MTSAHFMKAASARHRAPTPPFVDRLPPGLASITASDLRRDLFVLADDRMRGREAGTLDELRAAAWLAERARTAGLEPAGDQGTYFQFWPMRRLRTSVGSRLEIGGTPLALGPDAVVFAPLDITVNAPLVWLDGPVTPPAGDRDLAGLAVALELPPPAPLPPQGLMLWGIRYTLDAIAQHTRALAERGAAAILFVSDAVAEEEWALLAGSLARGRYGIDDADVERPTTDPPVLWASRRLLERIRSAAVPLGTGRPTCGDGTSAMLSGTLGIERFEYPSVNVVARVRGIDAALGSEHVLFSAHHDHDGVRTAPDGETIWSGADDNASGSAALLAIGRAFARYPARRSALFVWHGAEERGLLGSRWFVAHPTVPLGSITAVLNADLLGRNDANSAALLGVLPPHCSSRALVQHALEANARITHFEVDSSWDEVTHPEGWFFRGDHVPYARAGVPALFFSSLLHPDYHTPRDVPWAIDYGKLARMAQWMYATGWSVGTVSARPALEEDFKLER